MKAVTFSFDDGVKQDIRAIEILDKYGLKGTFNLNSAKLGTLNSYEVNGKTVNRNMVEAHCVKEAYRNHEVASHTLCHPNLTELSDQTVVRQVEEDRKALEALVGYPVRGMAYPCGGINNDDRVAGLIGKNTPIRFARTITSTYSFDLQENLLRFDPTVHFAQVDKLFALAKSFLEATPDKPRLFYIWGHTYEMDAGHITWEQFEKFCDLISRREDIFYGTNSEVLL